jgi:hypothetical protein
MLSTPNLVLAGKIQNVDRLAPAACPTRTLQSHTCAMSDWDHDETIFDRSERPLVDVLHPLAGARRYDPAEAGHPLVSRVGGRLFAP